MMQLRYSESPDFFALNKPYDIRTQQLSDGQFGFVDFMSEKLSQSLYVVHRLDKGASGIMLLARSRESAAALSQQFEKQQIKSTYFLLTDKPHTETSFSVTSFIQKQNNKFVNSSGKIPNSETAFRFVKTLGSYFLWQAFPKGEMPHQIRLHAEKAKIPILGDSEHGGTKYFRLALHSQAVEFNYGGTDFKFEAELPPIFSAVFDSELAALFNENFSKRRELYDIGEFESYRLLHLESAALQADIMHDHLWIYDYSKHGLSAEDQKAITDFAVSKNLKTVIRHLFNRGEGVGGLENITSETSGEASDWIAAEETTRYKLKLDSGISCGLPLDQRENRKWVRKNAAGISVLNLFSYTSSFSLNAALGLASEVVTVDVSSKFLDWSKENFRLNNLSPDNYEFSEDESLLFLKAAIKADRKWDLIICDPPSFARNKNTISRLEQDLPVLAKIMVDCLNPGGKILFTCNLEFSRSEIVDLFLKNQKKAKLEITRLPMLSLDHELTDDLNNQMKGFFVSKPGA